MQRQRILIGVFGLLAIGFAGRSLWTTYHTEPLEAKREAIRSAAQKTASLNTKVVAARADRLELDELAHASLPNDPVRAQERYQARLIQLLQTADIGNPTITPGQPSLREQVSFIPFTIQTETTMERFARFLYFLSSDPRLQLVRRLSLQPIGETDKGRAIRFSATVEAIGLGEADAAAPVGPAEPRLDAYRALLGRNVLAREPGAMMFAANMPEHVVLTAIVHHDGLVEADLYDRARDRIQRLRLGDECTLGEQRATVLEMGPRELVLESDGKLWRWKLGDAFAARSALSPTEALVRAARNSQMRNAE